MGKEVKPTKKVITFDGDFLSSTFINDQDTTLVQYTFEWSVDNSYDFTFAAIDKNNKRCEYIITASAKEFHGIADMIERVLKENKQSS